jgi:hypothetical protein
VYQRTNRLFRPELQHFLAYSPGSLHPEVRRPFQRIRESFMNDTLNKPATRIEKGRCRARADAPGVKGSLPTPQGSDVDATETRV